MSPADIPMAMGGSVWCLVWSSLHSSPVLFISFVSVVRVLFCGAPLILWCMCRSDANLNATVVTKSVLVSTTDLFAFPFLYLRNM